MIEIVFASNNEHKIFEMNEIAKPYGFCFVSPKSDFDPVEDGKTFEENAIIKAFEASKLGGGKIFLSDDSGLCVDALNGEPGINSARYAPTNDERISKVLENLKNERNAYFICSMALSNDKGEIIHTTEGISKGQIALSPKGEGGFGYDPIFIPNGYDLTLAQISQEEKNKISHRARALNDMLIWIKLGNF